MQTCFGSRVWRCVIMPVELYSNGKYLSYTDCKHYDYGKTYVSYLMDYNFFCFIYALAVFLQSRYLIQNSDGLILCFKCIKSIACELRRRHLHKRGFFTVVLASAVSPQRVQDMRNTSGAWQNDVTQLHTRLAQWQLYGLLTGGPLKFTNILYKAAKWLGTDSSSPAHVSVCTCMLTPAHTHAERQPSFKRKADMSMHKLSNTHFNYNLL